MKPEQNANAFAELLGDEPEDNIDEAAMAARRERYAFLVKLAASALTHLDKPLVERVRQERQKAENK